MKTLKDYFGSFPFLTTSDLLEIQAIGEEKKYAKDDLFIH